MAKKPIRPKTATPASTETTIGPRLERRRELRRGAEFLGERRDIPISNVSRTVLSGTLAGPAKRHRALRPSARKDLPTSILCGWCPVKHISRFIWIARPHRLRLWRAGSRGGLDRVPAPPPPGPKSRFQPHRRPIFAAILPRAQGFQIDRKEPQ